jgi:hypothetical protein
MLLEAAETVLGYFGFDRAVFDAEAIRKNNKKCGMNLQKNGLETQRARECENWRS